MSLFSPDIEDNSRLAQYKVREEIDVADKENGSLTRLGAELAWMVGPVSLKSEYDTLQLNGLNNGKTTANFGGNSGYVSLGWFLTGEQQPWKDGLPQAVTPTNPFVFGKGGTGAIQLVGRYEWLEMDKSILGVADPTHLYTNGTAGCSFGLNWYLNDVVRIQLTYYTTFDNPITVSVGTTPQRQGYEQAIMTRFQMVW